MACRYHCILVKQNVFCLVREENSEKVHNFEIECNGHTIKAQSSVKYLSVNLDNLLSGETIANSIIGKVNARLKLLYRQCSCLDEQTRKFLCSALIRCHLGYSCTSWYAGLNKTLKKKNQVSQNKVVWFIKKLGPRSHIGYSELDSLGFLNVENKVKQLRLNHVFKVFNSTCPSYLSEHFRKVSDFDRYTPEEVPRILLFHVCLGMLPQLSSSMALKTGIHYLQTLRGWKLSTDLKPL